MFLEETSGNWKRKGDILLGTWNVSSPYRACSLTAAARGLARYKLDLVGVQKVRWENWGHHKSRGLYFFLWKRKRKSSIGNRIIYTTE